ncbi:hypothetical protein RKD29_001195 [Streptomyces tendae]
MLCMDEMTHVVSKAAEPGSGPAHPMGVRAESATSTGLVGPER